MGYIQDRLLYAMLVPLPPQLNAHSRAEPLIKALAAVVVQAPCPGPGVAAIATTLAAAEAAASTTGELALAKPLAAKGRLRAAGQIWWAGATVVLDMAAIMEASIDELQQLVALMRALEGRQPGGAASCRMRMRSAAVAELHAAATAEPQRVGILLAAAMPMGAAPPAQAGSGRAASAPILIPLAPEEESSASASVPVHVLHDTVKLSYMCMDTRFYIAAHGEAARDEGAKCKDILAGSVGEVLSFLALLTGPVAAPCT